MFSDFEPLRLENFIVGMDYYNLMKLNWLANDSRLLSLPRLALPAEPAHFSIPTLPTICYYSTLILEIPLFILCIQIVNAQYLQGKLLLQMKLK